MPDMTPMSFAAVVVPCTDKIMKMVFVLLKESCCKVRIYTDLSERARKGLNAAQN